MYSKKLLSVLVCLLVELVHADDLRIVAELEQGCRAQTEEGVLDLTAVVNGRQSIYNTTSAENQLTTYWSPCLDVQPSPCEANAAVLKITAQPSCTVVAQNADGYFSIKNNKVDLSYKGRVNTPATHILLSCTNATSHTDFRQDSICDGFTAGNCYTFTHPTCCISNVYVQVSTAPSGGDTELNIGFILLVVLSMIGLCFVIVAIYKYVRRVDVSVLCPVVEINRTLPYLLQDGYNHVGRYGNEKKKRSAYEII